MANTAKGIAVFLVALVATMACAQSGTVTLESYPGMSVADGRSTLTVTALVRDERGSLVPDGTQVVFDTSLGIFREKVVTTKNGYARAILVAPDVTGFARVRASVLRFNAAGDLEIEFVGDRSMLSQARDYMEIEGAESLWYSVQYRVMSVTGPGQKAVVKYRDVTVEADDMQVKVPDYEVRARKAKVTIGKETLEFEELYMKLNRKSGFGLGTTTVLVPRESGSTLGNLGLEKREFFGLIEFDSKGVRKAKPSVDTRLLKFTDASDSLSKISAKSAIAFPRREIQFRKADVHMANQPLMQVPLFKWNINAASPIVTDSFFNVSNSQVNVSYPYYTSLSPSGTSLFRLRYGNAYGTGTGASAGTFLDFEQTWNRGDHLDGGLNVFGIGRSDWGVGLRQRWSNEDTTSLSLQVDLPAHRSIFAGANLSKQFSGYSMNLNGNYGTSLSGGFYQSNSASLVVEKDPMRLGPGRLMIGLRADQTRFLGQGVDTTQNSTGLQARFVSDTFRPSPNFTVNASFNLGYRTGTNVNQNLTQLGTLTLAGNPLPGMFFSTTYEYLNDGFTSDVLGHHKIGAELFYQSGPVSLSGYFVRSLDVSRTNISARMRYQLGPLWRFSYGYYFDQYGGDSFLDQSVILSYKLGFREVGLSYSGRTKRIGLELLGTSFP